MQQGTFNLLPQQGHNHCHREGKKVRGGIEGKKPWKLQKKSVLIRGQSLFGKTRRQKGVEEGVGRRNGEAPRTKTVRLWG